MDLSEGPANCPNVALESPVENRPSANVRYGWKTDIRCSLRALVPDDAYRVSATAFQLGKHAINLNVSGGWAWANVKLPI